VLQGILGRQERLGIQVLKESKAPLEILVQLVLLELLEILETQDPKVRKVLRVQLGSLVILA
jgi:hypothetical protein